MKKEETNDIVQYLLPTLEKLNIPRENCKVDVTTEKSGNKRGDVWISLKSQTDKDFEKNIVALIEAKHRNTTIGDMDWRDAMRQGKEKAPVQGLHYYVVTNCISQFRFYNANNDEEIILDGKTLTTLVSLEILQKIQSQVSSDISYVIHKASKRTRPIWETGFRNTLKKLADIYRSAGLKKGDERIDPTVSFVVLKYIGENEKESRTLDPVMRLWEDLRPIAYDEEVRDLRVEFEKMVELIWDERSQYKENLYKDFRNLINFPTKLKSEHFKKIYRELNAYHFHGANFDLFGAIYEEFASQTKKKEFGEFYTRRHITGMVARLLLRNEFNPRDLAICDPACGTGGFLTEAYKTLDTNYAAAGKLNSEATERLQGNTFWGHDNDEKSVARTKLNMFLVGDGHIHIYENDSLTGWNEEVRWVENQFDYIMTNPPMGQYDGDARIEDFDFTNERRYELLFLEKVIKAIKPGGEIAIVTNDGALEAPSREGFRKRILEACNIYAIVSLTKFAFAPYTKEKTYVLFMQRKQAEDVGKIQKLPIWHFILDYDGYANSDKRYRTKYHDNIPDLESLFDGAVALARIYSSDSAKFETERCNFEREVTGKEQEEGLFGMKYGYVEIESVNDGNFHNLLSEFHLRPVTMERITEDEFNEQIMRVANKFVVLPEQVDNIKPLVQSDVNHD